MKLEPTEKACDAGQHVNLGRFGRYVVTSESFIDSEGHRFLMHTCQFCGERWYTLIKE